MKRFLIVLAVIAAWAIPASTDSVNSLTPKEAAQGWKMLWDGKTMDGLKAYGKATWTIQDGALVSSGPGGWLGTADDYSKFIVKAEFRSERQDHGWIESLPQGNLDYPGRRAGFKRPRRMARNRGRLFEFHSKGRI